MKRLVLLLAYCCIWFFKLNTQISETDSLWQVLRPQKQETYPVEKNTKIRLEAGKERIAKPEGIKLICL